MSTENSGNNTNLIMGLLIKSRFIKNKINKCNVLKLSESSHEQQKPLFATEPPRFYLGPESSIAWTINDESSVRSDC